MTDSAPLPEVVDAEILPGVDRTEPVDLDAVLDGEIVQHPGYRIEDSPLYRRTRLTGRVVTDPTEREQIAARIEFGRLPWYRRLFAPKPVGWRS